MSTSSRASGATEHIAYLNGSFWITGRGLGVLRVDPNTGHVWIADIVGGRLSAPS